MAITSKDVKNTGNSEDFDPVFDKKTELETEKSTTGAVETTQLSVSGEPEIVVQAQKYWIITLLKSQSYIVHNPDRSFYLNVPVTTTDVNLAESCKVNSHFHVQEIN